MGVERASEAGAPRQGKLYAQMHRSAGGTITIGKLWDFRVKGTKAEDESGKVGSGEVMEGLECQLWSLLCLPKSLHGSSSSRAHTLTTVPDSVVVLQPIETSNV